MKITKIRRPKNSVKKRHHHEESQNLEASWYAGQLNLIYGPKEIPFPLHFSVKTKTHEEAYNFAKVLFLKPTRVEIIKLEEDVETNRLEAKKLSVKKDAEEIKTKIQKKVDKLESEIKELEEEGKEIKKEFKVWWNGIKQAFWGK